MAKKQKTFKPKARVPRGFRDMAGAELVLQQRMIATISDVYQSYGFDALTLPPLNMPMRWASFCPMPTGRMKAFSRWKMTTSNGSACVTT